MTTTQTPQEIDGQLAEIWKLQQQHAIWIAGEERRMTSRYATERTVAESTQTIARYQVEVANLAEQASPLESEYRARRWSRYFLVTNGNGHVHRERSCQTCFTTTQFAWLPELSGCDEAAMIAEFGEKACTVCFPDAPANPAFHAPGRRDAAVVAARAAEKAAKAEAKAAKAITAPDGSPLRVDGWVLQTKVAARNALSAAVQSYGWYGPTHPSDFAGQARQLVEALEAAGIETAPVIARAAAKVAA